jgi:hypothetical protein
MGADFIWKAFRARWPNISFTSVYGTANTSGNLSHQRSRNFSPSAKEKGGAALAAPPGGNNNFGF